MKTTLEIGDSLLDEARELAAREGLSLRALVERALRRALAESAHGAPFKLRRASFRGQGLRGELREADWDAIRELTYKDRGA